MTSKQYDEFKKEFQVGDEIAITYRSNWSPHNLRERRIAGRLTWIGVKKIAIKLFGRDKEKEICYRSIIDYGNHDPMDENIPSGDYEINGNVIGI